MEKDNQLDSRGPTAIPLAAGKRKAHVAALPRRLGHSGTSPHLPGRRRRTGHPPSAKRGNAVPNVLCIHSFASSSAQYQELSGRLSPRFRVLTADLYGHGSNPPWPLGKRFTLANEAAPFEALLPAGGTTHLVGHSYGAAVALRIARAEGQRIGSMVMYEPAIWGILSHLLPDEPATREIKAVRDETIRLIDLGQIEAATERFIDYWAGRGTWAASPEHRQRKLVASVLSLPAAWHATFDEQWPAGALRSLHTPCLLLTGKCSTVAARRAVGLLRDMLPAAKVIEFDGMGHLGPVTHPAVVDAAIEDFLISTPRRTT
jgi:pimeloyl-ACP methyl ester carboxylesterase